MMEKIGFNKVIINNVIEIERISKSCINYKDDFGEFNFDIEIGEPSVIYLTDCIKKLNVTNKKKREVRENLIKVLKELNYNFEIE